MAKKVIVLLALIFPAIVNALNLGDYYFERELYFEAVTEFKRQLFFNKSESKDDLSYKMALAYYNADQKQLAEEPLIEIITNTEVSDVDKKGLILLARIHWDNFDYEAMREVLNVLENRSDTLLQDQIMYITAWTFIFQAQWAKGIEILKPVRFINTDDLISDIQGVSKVPQKSKKAASIMSNIIPGSGQLYTGDHQNALYSFFLVGSVTGSIIWNIIDQAYFIAATKYFFLFSRYSRGGLKNLARKIDVDNIDRIGYYLKDISAKYPNPIEILKQL
ncbi:MAG: hypothetical protein KAU06_00175 [Candidatus Marinimicrobia bacterium]|nr:hypothetical protein [Candidatus Neomarinimicrobiota bacterium]